METHITLWQHGRDLVRVAIVLCASPWKQAGHLNLSAVTMDTGGITMDTGGITMDTSGIAMDTGVKLWREERAGLCHEDTLMSFTMK